MSEWFCALGRWYADPLTPQQAQTLLEETRTRRHPRAGRNRRCYTCQLQELVARYWLGEAVQDEYQRLAQRLRHTSHGRALLELIYGQLLMSRRLSAARRHLDEGFRRAVPLLSTTDYFAILRRHQQLARLPLTDNELPPQTLAALLTTAAVIERMTQGAPQWPAVRPDPDDIQG